MNLTFGIFFSFYLLVTVVIFEPENKNIFILLLYNIYQKLLCKNVYLKIRMHETFKIILMDSNLLKMIL